MIKLLNILKEINEAKQVGDLYHFTNLTSIISMISSRYIVPNDEDQISTTRRGNMDTDMFKKLENRVGRYIARLMLDGNKISDKYKLQPFRFEGDDLAEEQIVVDGENFYFMPYLKRIDFFIEDAHKSNVKLQKTLDKTIEVLETANIPYKIYQGKAKENIPFSQDKSGDPSQIQKDKLPTQIQSFEDLYGGIKSVKKIPSIELGLTQDGGIENINRGMSIPLSIYKHPKYPKHYVALCPRKVVEKDYKLMYFKLSGSEIENQFDDIKKKVGWTKTINNPSDTEYFNNSDLAFKPQFEEVPLLKDPDWRKKAKKTRNPLHTFENITHFLLIPKDKIQ